ncbi:MAG: histidine kinase [Chitinophagaceae bacterium]|nr:histidine kinase [Chitinophagaceae bacterium]
MLKKSGTIFTHITGWLIFLLLPLLFMAGQSEDTSIAQIFLSPYYWLFLFCYAVLFYTHTFFVFPEWYTGRKYFLYAAFLVVLFVAILLVSPFDKLVSFDKIRPRPEHFPGDGPRFPPDGTRPPRRGGHIDIVSIILYFLTLALSIAVITLRQLRKSEERALQAETDKVQAELSYLKARINPHFLFNTLNNLYALASENHENTGPAIMKLSNILRYVTDEVSDDLVELEKEINCIRDYIGLQQLRLSKTSVEFETNGDFHKFSIPPMILMTYIENAFKFGVSNREPSAIKIGISTENGMIEFYCENKVFAKGGSERNGIGLLNARHRLEHLYPHKFDLQITEGDVYRVKLKIFN